MGNITSLTRDNVGTNNYTGYTGNQLTQISGFTNSSYVYDENGNLKSDSQKGINLSYNYLNLPTQVSGNQNITYTYNAAGQKLKKVSGTNTTDYVAGIQYTNGVIEFIQTEEGVARRNGTDYSYEYNLTDHLGNVRATFYKNPNGQLAEVIQRDDYYAFGLRKMGIPNSNVNKYLYNGKELQEELGQYDYGARFYDPVVGRWNVVDPLAELHDEITPYNYVLNNPLLYSDEFGLDTTKRNQLLEVTIVGKRNNSANIITLPMPTRGVPTIKAIPPPNPFLLILAALLLPSNWWETRNGHRPGELSDEQKAKIHLSTGKTVDDLKEGKTKSGTTGGKDKGSGKGEGTEIWEGEGGMNQADQDFDKVAVEGTIKSIPGGRVGKTTDNRVINVRNKSSDGNKPTVEVYNPQTKKADIKFRYK